MIKYSRNAAYGLLIVLLISLLLIAQYSGGELRDVSLNLSSEILGIFIVVLLIENSIKEEAEVKRHKLLQTVFRRLGPKYQLSFMRDMVHSLAPKGSYDNYSDIGNRNYYEYLKNLDFNSKGPGFWSDIGKDMSWADYITYRSKEFDESISKIITNYALYLEPEELGLLQSIMDSKFMGFALKIIPTFMSSKKGFSDYKFFNSNGSREMIEEYINLLWKLSQLYNKYCPLEETIDIPSAKLTCKD